MFYYVPMLYVLQELMEVFDGNGIMLVFYSTMFICSINTVVYLYYKYVHIT